MKRLAAYLLATTSIVSFALTSAQANPLDPNVVAGDAAIAGVGTADMTINQSTDKAIIDWRTFNIDLGESTTFLQPSNQSVTLNRVTGGDGASHILGRLSANGQVFLINPDGILFGEGSQVDVGGLVATTHDILNSDFLNGNYTFGQPGSEEASIVNLGTITVEDGGFTALVAPGVRNAGTIRANLGQIGLASADGFVLDFYGDELLQLAVDDTTSGSVIDLQTGQTLKDLVSNSGLLSASGGTVQLTASAARAVVNSVINNTGNIEADTIGTRNGKIVLGASTSGTKPADAPVQQVKVSGTLSAAGHDAGETGGTIQLTGELIELTVATIDAFGWNGGGTVLVGGDYMGGNGDPAVVDAYDIALEDHAVPTSAYVFADQLSSIDASATQVGDGGKIILWSDVATLTAAAFSARGGSVGGDGGFIETSGKYLDVRSAADASAPNGEAGTWLLDPLNVRLKAGVANNWFYNDQTILTDVSVSGDYYSSVYGRLYYPNGSDSYIDTNVLSAALNAGNNVYVTTRGTVGSADGDIYVESDIRRTAGSGTRFLVLDAADDMIFSSGVDLVSTTDEMHIFLWARDGSISAPNMGQVDTNGGVFKMDIRDGVLMHSDYDSPAIVGLEIFAQSGAPRRDVELEFSTDKVKFHYVDGVAYVLTDGIRLVDSSDSYFELIAHNLDGVYYDRAIRIDANKGFRAIPDPGFNQGAHPSAAMNDRAEIIAPPGTTLEIGDEPLSLQAIPVVEISTDGNSRTDILAPTSLGGQRLLAQKLAGTATDELSATQRQIIYEQLFDAMLALQQAQDLFSLLYSSVPAPLNAAESPTSPSAYDYLEELRLRDAALQDLVPPPIPQESLTPVLAQLVAEVSDTYSYRDVSRLAAISPYAEIALAAYAEEELSSGENYSWGASAPEGWSMLDTEKDDDNSNGLSAVAYRNKATGEIVIGYRGSITDKDWMVNFGLVPDSAIDWIAENIIPGDFIKQFPGNEGSALLNRLLLGNPYETFLHELHAEAKQAAADRFAGSIAFAMALRKRYPSVPFKVVGHSLGGGIAHYVAATMKIEAIAFDPAPITAYLDAVNQPGLAQYQNIRNFKNPNDPLSDLTFLADYLSDIDQVGNDPESIKNVPSISIRDELLALSALDISGLAFNHSMVGLKLAFDILATAEARPEVWD